MIDFRRHRRPIYELNLAVDRVKGKLRVNAELGEESFEGWELFSQRNWVGKCPPVVLLNTFDIDDSKSPADAVAASLQLLTPDPIKSQNNPECPRPM
jgi:hypothetical protein